MSLAAAIIFGSFCAVGAALLGYGVYAELSKMMSGGLAAMLAGAMLIIVPCAILIVRNKTIKNGAPSKNLTEKHAPPESAAPSAIGAMARSAFIALAGRRPIAMLGLAAIIGAVVSTTPSAEKDSHVARRQ